MDGMPTWVTIVLGVIAALGGRELLSYWVKRRDDRSDADRADRAKRATDVSVVEAGANATVLKTLLEQMQARIDGYEGSIRDMRDTHVRDMAEIKAENRQLDRQVQDLRAALRDYQLGNRVPRGQVLLPLREVRRIRELHPGLLNADEYPGEEDVTDGPRGVVARITPVTPQPPRSEQGPR